MKVATVVAARPDTVLTPAAVAAKAVWAGLVWASRSAPRLAVAAVRCVTVLRLAGAAGAGAGWFAVAGVAVQIRVPQ